MNDQSNEPMIPLVSEREILPGKKIGGTNPFFLVAGPCVIETPEVMHAAAKSLHSLRDELGLVVFFKSSYDKANRSSITSYRGPGLKEGLSILEEIKKEYDFPIVTDIHTPAEAEEAARVADILQIPAFLCRQTDLVLAAAATGKWVNIKKGQFVAPRDVVQIVEKFREGGSERYLICERGFSFGYNNLVVDMRSLEIIRRENIPVVIDVTHSTQLPGGGVVTGGDREMSQPLGRAAAAAGIEGVFLEIHPDPPAAKSDATTQLDLVQYAGLVRNMAAIDRLVKNNV